MKTVQGENEGTITKVDWASKWVLVGKLLMPSLAVVFVLTYFLYYV